MWEVYALEGLSWRWDDLRLGNWRGGEKAPTPPIAMPWRHRGRSIVVRWGKHVGVPAQYRIHRVQKRMKPGAFARAISWAFRLIQHRTPSGAFGFGTLPPIDLGAPFFYTLYSTELTGHIVVDQDTESHALKCWESHLVWLQGKAHVRVTGLQNEEQSVSEDVSALGR